VQHLPLELVHKELFCCLPQGTLLRFTAPASGYICRALQGWCRAIKHKHWPHTVEQQPAVLKHTSKTLIKAKVEGTSKAPGMSTAVPKARGARAPHTCKFA
jgi:hypothetical protein